MSPIEAVGKIVTYFKQAVNAMNQLRSLQIRIWNRKEGDVLKLKKDVSTRWNSKFYMLKRFRGLTGLVAQV